MSGLCTPWVDAETVAACCGADLGSDEILFEISGRRWRGPEGCDVIVRPCDDRCSGWPLQILSGSGVVVQWYAGLGGYWGWGYGWGGPWQNLGCGCCGLSQVKLAGYPVTEILEVTIDGVVLDPSEYRLDHARMLTRMADADGNAQTWPSCQRLDRELGDDGTFGITYRYGVAPPQAGINAAKALACELARSCADGAECQIPPGVTKVTRQGVQIEQGLVSSYIRDGKTSLADLDTFVAAYGGIGKLPRRSIVWSPSMKPYARSYGGGTDGT